MIRCIMLCFFEIRPPKTPLHRFFLLIFGGISASLGKIIPIFDPEGQNHTPFLPMDPKKGGLTIHIYENKPFRSIPINNIYGCCI